MSPLEGVGLAILSLVLWIGARRSSDRPEHFWAAAWSSTIASGALLLLAPSASPALVAYLGPVFPAGQLAGALAFTRGRAPGWIVPVALLAGLMRVGSVQWGFEELVDWIPRAVEPAGTLAAAYVLYRAVRWERSPWSLSAVPWLLLAAGILDLLSAPGGAPQTRVTPWLGMVWLSFLVVGMPMQLRLAGHRYTRREVQLRHETEADLAESQLRFRAITESAFDLIAELDSDERFTYVNPRYEELLGYPREEMLGRLPAEFVHPDDIGALRRFADQADKADVATDLVLRARRTDGSYIWLECVAHSYPTPQGNRRWVMNSRDVSDRVEREEMRELDHARLAQSVTEGEDRFRALTEQAPELISEFDDQGRCMFANESFRELIGIDPKTLIGRRPQHLIHHDDLPASLKAITEAFRTGRTTHVAHRLLHADGSWRWFENTGRVYRSAGGSLRFVAIGRDVTEARRQEEERRTLEHHVREAQRLDSLGALASGIAHDFNNLLAVILGNVALLEGNGLSREALGRLRRIRSAAAHAEALTDQMLTYAGKSVSELGPVDLSKLVHETEELLLAAVAGKGRLEVELDPDLPSVRGDATQLRQVLLNLVANGTEAIGKRGGTIRVSTAARELAAADLATGFGTSERPPGRWVQLEVADDGPGIDPAVRDRIFEPFFTTRARGRGLGLASVLGIAGAHGGVLKLETGPGLGTTFRLLLPCSGEEATRRRLPPRDGAASERDGLVLVVDDDEAVNEIAKIFLERGGYRVVTATGGSEALRILESGEAIDAMLLDLEMPRPSGAELLEQIRRERPELPVVIASGYRRDLAAERVGGSETCGFVEKPFHPEALLSAIDEALSRDTT